jgi:glycosyltransferase involved in cell wall biosynthesis
MATLKRSASKVITLPNGHSPNNSLNILHLIIPVHAPSAGWSALLESRCEELRTSVNKSVEIKPIMVVDGPVSEAVKKDIDGFISRGWELIWLAENQGKGEALRRGTLRIDSGFMLFTDVDMPYSCASMQAIIASLLEGADVVFGKRNKKYLQALPLQRRLISSLLKLFNKRLLRLKHPDTQCGLKGFSLKGMECLLATKTKSFSFDIELALLASKKKEICWQAVDVELREGIVFREMNLAVLKHELRNLWEIIKK